jgi:pimeloyl-ACP methyl ester carboxylesterase
MPFVKNRGQRIHYEVRGEGPTIVLQHGLLSCASRWETFGYVGELANDHQVVWVDSLGHGESDKPCDASLYSRRQRAGDLVAVFDAVGAERVHLVGYSMGGWMATAVALHHPERLASVTVGGWDLIDGPSGALPAELRGTRPSFDFIVAGARRSAPEVVGWITPEVEPAVSACWDSLFEFEGAVEALGALDCAVMLWSGADDPCNRTMRGVARGSDFLFLSTPGDHASALRLGLQDACARLRELSTLSDAR